MNAINPESLAAALAIIGVVIIVSALLSGLIDRSGLPQVAVFLALGAALGRLLHPGIHVRHASALSSLLPGQLALGRFRKLSALRTTSPIVEPKPSPNQLVSVTAMGLMRESQVI